jgi:hypothetical protein
MLSYVSWKDYLLAMVILLAVYYVCLGLKYYRDEIKALLRKFPKRFTTGDESQQPNLNAANDAEMDELEFIINDLRYAIFERAGKHIGKSELFELLKERLADYNGLYKPAFRVALNNFIIQHAKEICGVTYNEDELNSAWDKL